MQTSCLVSSRGCIARKNSREQELVWRQFAGLLIGTGDEPGPRVPWIKVPLFISRYPSKDRRRPMSRLRPILLAEDNPQDVELALTALEAHHLANRVVVARDG